MIVGDETRNQKLYVEWKAEHTIEQASKNTKIPMSSVGYYYKKFDRYEKEGRPIPTGPQESEKTDSINVQFQRRIGSLQSAQKSEKVLRDIESLKMGGKYEEAYYLAKLHVEERKIWGLMSGDMKDAAGDLGKGLVDMIANKWKFGQGQVQNQYQVPQGYGGMPHYDLTLEITRDKEGNIVRDRSGRVIPKMKFDPVMDPRTPVPEKQGDRVVRRITPEIFLYLQDAIRFSTSPNSPNIIEVLEMLDLWNPAKDDPQEPTRRTHTRKQGRKKEPSQS